MKLGFDRLWLVIIFLILAGIVFSVLQRPAADPPQSAGNVSSWLIVTDDQKHQWENATDLMTSNGWVSFKDDNGKTVMVSVAAGVIITEQDME